NPLPQRAAPPLDWVFFEEGLHWIGHSGDGFAYDNESPRHRHFLEHFLIATRPVTCGEFLAFMEEDGYKRAELWLSAGWATVQEQQWTHPFYWAHVDGQWYHF